MKLEVGIIGSGLSGLSAAYELYQQLGTNVHVTILEKEPQLGGRIFTKKFNGCPIELGAQFFIHGGTVQNLVKSLGLKSDVIPLGDNFISFYYDKKIYSRDHLQMISLFKTSEGIKEKEELLKYAKEVNASKNLINFSFDEWYRNNIGEHSLPFWNRMLISIGIRDVKSINAYFGLIIVNVLFGSNYLLKGGLEQLVNKLSEKITSLGGEIITDARCKVIEKNGNKYRIEFEKERKTKEREFDRIISAIPPKDLRDICNFDILRPLQKIEGHPMALYVIKSNTKLWDNTWGLIISEEKNPIYALCDWKNITDAHRDTPLLTICSPYASIDEIIHEFRVLFPGINPQCKIIFEKKWDTGLHQLNPEFFKICEKVSRNLPDGMYLAGDWMTLPALEGAVISGTKAVQLLIRGLK